MQLSARQTAAVRPASSRRSVAPRAFWKRVANVAVAEEEPAATKKGKTVKGKR